jgi:MFS family permease
VLKKTGGLGAAYWRLWWANAVSTTGDGAFLAALPLLAVTVTHSPRLISVVAAATYAPWLLLSLPAGVLIDRRDRTRLMRRSQLMQGAVVAVVTALVATRQVSIGVLAVAGFLLGSAEVVFSNAAQSTLPLLVSEDRLARANGNQYVVQTIGQSFVGPPVGSVLFAAMKALPFGVDAASFAVSATLLTKLPPQRPRAGAPVSMLGSIREGLRWLFGHRVLRLVAILLGVNNFCGQMGMATLVLLATQTLHVSARGFGLLLTAIAVGSVTGGLVNPIVTRRIGMLASLIVASALNAAVYLGIGLAPSVYVVGALLAVNGFLVTMWNVVTVTLRQRVVPDELRGRVNSAYRMFGWGLMPLGALAGGFVAAAFGLRAPYTIAGITRGLALLVIVPALLAASRAAAASGRLGAVVVCRCAAVGSHLRVPNALLSAGSAYGRSGTHRQFVTSRKHRKSEQGEHYACGGGT